MADLGEGVSDEGETRQGGDDQSHGEGSVLGGQLGQGEVERVPWRPSRQVDKSRRLS